MALVGLTPAIAQLGTTIHHNDLDVYAIDADPATGMAYRGAQVHGTVVRYLHALDVTMLRADGPKADL